MTASSVQPDGKSATEAAAERRRSTAGGRPIPWSFADLMLAGAARRGGDRREILRRAGLTLEVSNPLTEAEFAMLLRQITRTTGDEFWGLASAPLPIGSFEALCRAAARERTLGAALRAGGRILRIALPGVAVRILPDPPNAFIAVSTHPSWPPLSESALVFLVYGLASWMIGAPAPLLGVEVRHARSSNHRANVRYYGTTVEYERPWTRMRLTASALDLPVVIDERRLDTFLKAAPLGLVVRYRDPLSVTEKLRGLLRRSLSDVADLAAAADALSTTPQTLHRKLAAEGVTYQDVKDEVRRDIALELLFDRRNSLEDIALRIGFSEHSSFHRAFRRWTGRSPGAFRPPPAAD